MTCAASIPYFLRIWVARVCRSWCGVQASTPAFSARLADRPAVRVLGVPLAGRPLGVGLRPVLQLPGLDRIAAVGPAPGVPRRDRLGRAEAVQRPGRGRARGGGPPGPRAEHDHPVAAVVLGLVRAGPVDPGGRVGPVDVAGSQGRDLAGPGAGQELELDHRGDRGREVGQGRLDGRPRRPCPTGGRSLASPRPLASPATARRAW